MKGMFFSLKFLPGGGGGKLNCLAFTSFARTSLNLYEFQMETDIMGHPVLIIEEFLTLAPSGSAHAFLNKNKARIGSDMASVH